MLTYFIGLPTSEGQYEIDLEFLFQVDTSLFQGAEDYWGCLYGGNFDYSELGTLEVNLEKAIARYCHDELSNKVPLAVISFFALDKIYVPSVIRIPPIRRTNSIKIKVIPNPVFSEFFSLSYFTVSNTESWQVMFPEQPLLINNTLKAVVKIFPPGRRVLTV